MSSSELTNAKQPIATPEDGVIKQTTDYYPYGMKITPLCTSNSDNPYLYNGKEMQNELGLDWYDYGARFYDPALGRFHSIDPLSGDFPSWTPYHYVHNNPLNMVVPSGMSADWVEKENQDVYWDENATSQSTTKKGETYLGKNVLVGTHNRDASGKEEINTAQFDLYLESDKTGASASIKGNTVPGDVSKFGI